jgi:hypothetical protein
MVTPLRTPPSLLNINELGDFNRDFNRDFMQRRTSFVDFMQETRHKIGMKIDIVERALAISVSIFDRIEQPLSISIAISILKIDKSNARLKLQTQIAKTALIKKI